MHVRSLVLNNLVFNAQGDAQELRVDGLSAGLTAFFAPPGAGKSRLASFLADGLLGQRGLLELRGAVTRRGLRGTIEAVHANQLHSVLCEPAAAKGSATSPIKNISDGLSRWLAGIPLATRGRFVLNLSGIEPAACDIAAWFAASFAEGPLRGSNRNDLLPLLRRRDQLADRLDDLLTSEYSRRGPLDWEPRKIDSRLTACTQELRRCDEEHARLAAELASLTRWRSQGETAEPIISRLSLANDDRSELDGLDQQIALWRQALHAGDRRDEAVREERNQSNRSVRDTATVGHASHHGRLAAELESLGHCQRAVRTHVDQLLRMRRSLAERTASAAAVTERVALPQVHDEKQHTQLAKRLEELEAARRALRAEIEDCRALRDEVTRGGGRGVDANELVEIRAELREVEASIHAALNKPTDRAAERGGPGEWASAQLRAISGDRLRRLFPAAGGVLRVTDAHHVDVPVESLPKSLWRLVALAATLAHAESCHARGIELPLVLDEPCAGQADDTARAVADVLWAYAAPAYAAPEGQASGRQVLVFTDHAAAAEQLRRHGADVRELCRRSSPQTRPRTSAPQPATLRLHAATEAGSEKSPATKRRRAKAA